MAEQSTKERAKATRIAGGPGSEHIMETGDMRKVHEYQDYQRKREQADERQLDTSDNDKAHRLETASYTELEERMAARAEGGLAARTAQEMSLHDELNRTPTASSKEQQTGKERPPQKQGDTPTPPPGKQPQEGDIEPETQHEKRRQAIS